MIIQNSTDLKRRIMKLNYLKEEQEMAVKRNIRELIYSVHPSMVFRNLFNKVTDDPGVKQGIATAGIGFGKDFLISRLLGRAGIKGYISALVLRKATDYLMNNHSERISEGFHKLKDLVKDGLSRLRRSSADKEH